MSGEALRPKPPRLTVTDVTCRIGRRDIVSGASFEVPPGARCAIVGANGAGKSTLLKVMAGINQPVTGSVTLDGECVSSMRGVDRARKMAFVGQEELPPDDLSVTEMVSLGRVPHRPPWEVGGRAESVIIDEALAQVDLLDKASRTTAQLSGGERRRALLARGLAQQAPLLMLDEPTNHLDVQWQHKLLSLCGAYDGTVVAAVHDLDLVWRHFDKVAVVNGGTVAACGPTQDVLTADLIRAAFGVDSTVVRNNVTGDDHLLTFATTT